MFDPTSRNDPINIPVEYYFNWYGPGKYVIVIYPTREEANDTADPSRLSLIKMTVENCKPVKVEEVGDI